MLIFIAALVLIFDRCLFPTTALAAPAATAPPAEFTPNPSIGGGSGTYKDSAHFRVYGVNSSTADQALKILEAAHICFVEQLGWRTPGVSINVEGDGTTTGPWYKLNVYNANASEIGEFAGQMWTDMDAGLAYLKVKERYMTDPDVTVHEYGHTMHFSEKNWIDQTRTGAWWETIAEFIADVYVATETCTSAKATLGLNTTLGNSIFAPRKVIGDSFQVLVDGNIDYGNYYEAFPFLIYITNNPDNYSGLGKTVVLDMIRKYKLDSNETPLHSLERLLSGTTIQQVVGRYWARMAYVDIGHAKALEKFNKQRSNITYANLDNSGNGTFTVKAARAPRYMGASIIPLNATDSTVSVTITANEETYTATLAVKAQSGSVRYVEIVNGSGSVKLASGEEATLVVANTPALVQYDAFDIPDDLNTGLTYSIQLSGATA